MKEVSPGLVGCPGLQRVTMDLQAGMNMEGKQCRRPFKAGGSNA